MQTTRFSKRTTEPLLRTLEVGGLLYGLVLILSLWKFVSSTFLWGIFVGTAIAIFNFRIWQWFGKKLIQIQSSKKLHLFFFMGLKGLTPILMIAFAIWVFKIDVLGLLLGLSAIVFVILMYAVWLIFQHFMFNKE